MKMMIVMRTDLNMRKGKMIAQGAHAAMMPLVVGVDEEDASAKFHEWLFSGMTKICVQVGSEQELDEVAAKARISGLECNVVTDAGRTEFGGVPTKTCLSIGPDEEAKLDAITGGLKLL